MEHSEVEIVLWERFQTIIANDRLPQALLFVGPYRASMQTFIHRLIARLVCQEKPLPCGQCRPCHLLKQGSFPDLEVVCPESPGSVIKVEQVRALQQGIYQMPQLGARRFIVIDSADKMNVFAANALLKILEEPPAHTLFILLAEQVSTIPATILSRCQRHFFPSPIAREGLGYLDNMAVAALALTDASRAQLFEQRENIMASLCELFEGQLTPCTLAEQWVSYEWNDIVWLLYLVTADAIRYQLVANPGSDSTMHDSIPRFFSLLNPIVLFKQLDYLQSLILKIATNVNVNRTLALEDLLMGYCRK